MSSQLLSDYCFLHYNYKYDWFRPTLSEIIELYKKIYGKDEPPADDPSDSESGGSSESDEEEEEEDGEGRLVRARAEKRLVGAEDSCLERRALCLWTVHSARDWLCIQCSVPRQCWVML